jgi:hypothetical protein
VGKAVSPILAPKAVLEPRHRAVRGLVVEYLARLVSSSAFRAKAKAVIIRRRDAADEKKND